MHYGEPETDLAACAPGQACLQTEVDWFGKGLLWRWGLQFAEYCPNRAVIVLLAGHSYAKLQLDAASSDGWQNSVFRSGWNHSQTMTPVLGTALKSNFRMPAFFQLFSQLSGFVISVCKIGIEYLQRHRVFL